MHCRMSAMFAAMNGERPSSTPCPSLNKSNNELHLSCKVLEWENGNHVRIPLERVNELAPEERMRGFDDLHGVSTIPTESPKQTYTLLDKFDQAMLNLTDCNSAYELAKGKDFGYTQGLRIRFLRKSAFDPVEAARNMAYHFQLRKQYFGDKELIGDLTFANFKPQDIPYVSTGFAQLLPERDRSGRSIFAVYGQQYCITPLETIVRIQLIYGDIATKDEDIQRNGVVFIYFGYKQTEKSIFYPNASLAIQGNPMRIVARHVCYDNPLLHPILNETVCQLPSHLLIRFKCHFGSVPECLHSLRAFGLPVEAFPINSDGTWKISCADNVRKTLAKLNNKSNESKTNPSSSNLCNSEVLEPRDTDVVMGRGKRGVKSLGNQRLKTLQEEFRTKYEFGSRQTKVLITRTIFDAMVHSGARFLMQATDRKNWVIVNELEAKKSIAHGFRNMRRIDRARLEQDPLSPFQLAIASICGKNGNLKLCGRY